MDIRKLAILGSGSMGTAILHGLIKAGLSPDRVCVTTKTQASATKLANTLGVQAIALEVEPQANQTAVAGADLALLAVKPAFIIPTLQQVSTDLDPEALVVSVAAGVPTARMEGAVPASVGVVRAMPNTPALIGLGVTGVAAGSRTTTPQLALAERLFETVGKVVVIPEDLIDELGTISGSGPAYVFYLIEQFVQTAMNMGFDAPTAHLLVSQTFLGASALLEQSGKSPEELRAQVTSPNGTTMRAIAVLEDSALQRIFAAATAAALARSKELAAGN